MQKHNVLDSPNKISNPLKRSEMFQISNWWDEWNG